jgi:RND family efflux transporter MFP subunit
VDIGDKVKRGALLAEIDAPLLVLEEKQAAVAVRQAKGAMMEAEARSTTARAEVEVAEAVVHEKQAAHESARSAVTLNQEQLGRLRATGAAGRIDLDEKARQVESARAQASAAEAALLNAKADVKVKQSKVAQAEAARETAQAGLEIAELAMQKARYSSSLTRLTAPFDGVITQRNYFAGDTVRTGEQGNRSPLLTLMRIDSVRVVVDAPEAESATTNVGTLVDLEFDSLQTERLKGYKVSRIGFAQDPNTGLMRVEVDVPNPDARLRPGMKGRAVIHLGKGDPKTFRLPDTAVVVQNGKYVVVEDNQFVVYVVREGKAHRTRIKAVLGGGDEIEVLSGLKATDRVVLDPRGLSGDVIPVEVKQKPDGK